LKSEIAEPSLSSDAQSQVAQSAPVPVSFRSASRRKSLYSSSHLPRHRRIETECMALACPFGPQWVSKSSQVFGPHNEAAFF
jgi:hypothetical protein